MDRRTFLERISIVLTAASSLGTLTASTASATQRAGAAGIGICDWNLGPMCDPEQIPRAAEANLEGIQVSLGRTPEEIILTDPTVRKRYVELGRQHDITF
ncbi:MAG: hypothetical protein JSW71_16445, partial [Gemmatimonadota bacterium]